MFFLCVSQDAKIKYNRGQNIGKKKKKKEKKTEIGEKLAPRGFV